MPRNLTRVRNTRPPYIDSDLAALTPGDWDSTVDHAPSTPPRRLQSFGWADILYIVLGATIATAALVVVIINLALVVLS